MTYFDDVIDVDLPVLVVVEGLGDALQLVLWNVLDLPHDADQLVDANEILPIGVEQTAYRKRFVTKCNGEVVEKSEVNMMHSRFPDLTSPTEFQVKFPFMAG